MKKPNSDKNDVLEKYNLFDVTMGGYVLNEPTPTAPVGFNAYLRVLNQCVQSGSGMVPVSLIQDTLKSVDDHICMEAGEEERVEAIVKSLQKINDEWNGEDLFIDLQRALRDNPNPDTLFTVDSFSPLDEVQPELEVIDDDHSSGSRRARKRRNKNKIPRQPATGKVSTAMWSLLDRAAPKKKVPPLEELPITLNSPAMQATALQMEAELAERWIKETLGYWPLSLVDVQKTWDKLEAAAGIPPNEVELIKIMLKQVQYGGQTRYHMSPVDSAIQEYTERQTFR